jgi:hypothetical protein
MKNWAILCVVLASALSACGDVSTKFDRSPQICTPCASSNTIQVNVAIVNGKIHAPEDTYTYANHEVIAWTIITPGNYTFPDRGIEFEKHGVFNCLPRQGGNKTFTCRKNGHPLGKYKYTVNVNAGSNPLAPLPLKPLDPVILNM